jgi:hypothetical protein
MICTKCKKPKPLREFRARPTVKIASKSVLPWCNQCKREYDRIKVAQKRALIAQAEEKEER